jgi:hypothetical protein
MDGLLRSVGSSLSNVVGGVFHAAGDAFRGVVHAANQALPGGIFLVVAFVVLVIVAWNFARR